jgi:apolipoprotein N-acyltransferase
LLVLHVNIPRLNKSLLAFIVGLLAVFGFAPFGLFPLTIFALTVLFTQWLRAENARAAALIGWAFGFGLFGAGTGWIYVALHDYGDMPFLLALPATALFSAFLALFPAIVGYAQARLHAPAWMRVTLVMPALWVLSEWLRGLLFTGFPWLAFGYSQAAASPLAGYAPLLGAYGVSLAVAVSAGLFVLLGLARWSRQGKIAWAILAMIWISGVALREVEWTQPQGAPIRVSLAQGNIPQELKFREEKLAETLEIYRKLVQQSDARLIVLPETAIPLPRQEVPENYAAILRDHARQNGGDIIIGAFEREHGQFYNSVFTLGTSPSQSYRKNHLVVFGEFIPLRPVLGWFINEVLHIPMGDLARGGIDQPPLKVAGQRVAANICYEDVFGEEIIRALPEATLLVNLSNDAWYGNSHAAMQHNQISQMRALETGRMMLRATNTGVTSIIGRSGHILQMLPQHEEGLLTGMVQGYAGSTPYARFGNVLVLGLIALLVGVAWWLGRKR